PFWAPGAALALDYYDIDLTGAIGQLGYQRIVDDCAAGNQELCAQIDRDPVTNRITRIEDFFTNIDAAAARGVDMEFSYRLEPDLWDSQVETMSIRLLSGYLVERSEMPSGGITADFAGSDSFPEWNTTASLNYAIGPWVIGLTHRFI